MYVCSSMQADKEEAGRLWSTEGINSVTGSCKAVCGGNHQNASGVRASLVMVMVCRPALVVRPRNWCGKKRPMMSEIVRAKKSVCSSTYASPWLLVRQFQCNEIGQMEQDTGQADHSKYAVLPDPAGLMLPNRMLPST